MRRHSGFASRSTRSTRHIYNMVLAPRGGRRLTQGTDLHGRIYHFVVVADGDEDRVRRHLVYERDGSLERLEGGDVEVRMNEVDSSLRM